MRVLLLEVELTKAIVLQCLKKSPEAPRHQGQCVCRGVANRITEVASAHKFLLVPTEEHTFTLTISKGPVQSIAFCPIHRGPTHRSARQQPESTGGGGYCY